jgi:hypothetical protein
MSTIDIYEPHQDIESALPLQEGAESEGRSRLPLVVGSILVGVVALKMVTPTELDPSRDDCTDTTHVQVFNVRPGDPDTVSEEVGNLDRGYYISPFEFKVANQTYLAHDSRGRIGDQIPSTTGKGLCMDVPGPVPAGFAVVRHDQTKADVMSMFGLAPDAFNTLNTQLAETPDDADLADGSTVRVAQQINPDLVLMEATGSIHDMAHGNKDLEEEMVAANKPLHAEDDPVEEGDLGYFPLKEAADTDFYKDRQQDPKYVVPRFAEDGYYNRPLATEAVYVEAPAAPAPAAPTEAAPAPAHEYSPEERQKAYLDAAQAMIDHGDVPAHDGVPAEKWVIPGTMMRDLIAQGMDPVIAAAFAGNASQESGYRPGAIQQGGDWAIGLLQWAHGRADRLKAFAAENNTTWDDPSIQDRYIGLELQTTEGRAWAIINSIKDVGEATRAICTYYERAGKPNMQARIDAAYADWDRFQSFLPEGLRR